MLSYNEGLEIIMKKVKEYLGENFTERSSVDDAITLNCKDFNIDVHINIIGRDYEILDVCESVVSKNNTITRKGITYALPFDKTLFLLPNAYKNCYEIIFSDSSETDEVCIYVY